MRDRSMKDEDGCKIFEKKKNTIITYKVSISNKIYKVCEIIPSRTLIIRDREDHGWSCLYVLQ